MHRTEQARINAARRLQERQQRGPAPIDPRVIRETWEAAARAKAAQKAAARTAKSSKSTKPRTAKPKPVPGTESAAGPFAQASHEVAAEARQVAQQMREREAAALSARRPRPKPTPPAVEPLAPKPTVTPAAARPLKGGGPIARGYTEKPD